MNHLLVLKIYFINNLEVVEGEFEEKKEDMDVEMNFELL